MNKGGLGTLGKIIVLVVVALIAITIVVFFFNSKDSSSTNTGSPTGTTTTTSEGTSKIKDIFRDTFSKTKELWSKTKTRTLEILGFERGVGDSFKDLLTGLIAGAIICGTYRLGKSVFKDPKIDSGWLKFIGDSWWKIAPVGIFYYIIHQIPFIKTAVQIVTLEFLITFKGNLAYLIIRPLIFAFILGMLPAVIEGYSKYKLRKKYREALIRVKADKATLEALRGP